MWADYAWEREREREREREKQLKKFSHGWSQWITWFVVTLYGALCDTTYMIIARLSQMITTKGINGLGSIWPYCWWENGAPWNQQPGSFGSGVAVGYVDGIVGKKCSLQELFLTSNHYFVLSAPQILSLTIVNHLVKTVVVESITSGVMTEEWKN